MIFELAPYNIPRLWGIFFALMGLNVYFVLRRRMFALDPKLYLMVFLSSINAFCIERYLSLGGLDVVYFIIMGCWCNICMLLMPQDKILPRPPPRVEDKWLPVLLVLCVVRLIFADIPHLIQFVESGFVVGVTESQTTGALLPDSTVLQYVYTMVLQFFQSYLFTYNLICSKVRWRRVVGLIGIVVSILSGYLGGSRATIFYTFLALGHFLLYFRHEIDLRRYWWRLTTVAGAAICAFFVLMVVFSGIRASDGNTQHVDLEFGADRVATRLLANADGIEYFLIFERQMETELYNFVKYNFVFIIKRLTGEDYPNLGRRLYQNAVGRDVNYGGPNFTVILQSRVAFGWLGLIYIPVLVLGLYLSRHVIALRGSFLDIYLYNMTYCMVWFFIDSEAQFARIITITTLSLPVLIYVIFVQGQAETVRFFPFLKERVIPRPLMRRGGTPPPPHPLPANRPV